jgi:ABC-2 type transport system ATP-binding protein
MLTIETHELGKRFPNGTLAVRSLNLTVGKGEIFGLLGPNGAGKTTTVRLLNGTLVPTQGSSTILGLPSQAQAVRFRTATFTEFALMYEHLTVMENLRFYGAMYEMQPALMQERIKTLLTYMQLWEKREHKLGTFSRGMKKRVHLVRTLLHQPEIVFLDEPTSGLDPESSRQVIDLIRQLAREHELTVFLCTHNLTMAEEICDTFGFILNGELRKTGKKEELIYGLRKEQKVRVTTTRGSYEFKFGQKEEINTYLKQLMDKGEYIVQVVLVLPSLEEVYFHYLKQEKNDAKAE